MFETHILFHFLVPAQRLLLYLSRSHMKYCSHFYAGASQYHLLSFDGIQCRVGARIVAGFSLSSRLDPLALQCDIGSLRIYLFFTAFITGALRN